jgi:hypothetical protein
VVHDNVDNVLVVKQADTDGQTIAAINVLGVGVVNLFEPLQLGAERVDLRRVCYSPAGFTPIDPLRDHCRGVFHQILHGAVQLGSHGLVTDCGAGCDDYVGVQVCDGQLNGSIDVSSLIGVGIFDVQYVDVLHAAVLTL